jgi:predicted dithiol-disulfide oxidoreductase (DUF899 family)
VSDVHDVDRRLQRDRASRAAARGLRRARRRIDRRAAERGWDNLRLVSAADSTFKRDFLSEADDGEQIERVSVFKKLPDGSLAHVYSSGAELGPGQRERGIDLLSPVWNLFDLTPEGRGDWYPSFDYTRGV